MDEKTLSALKASIKHWEENVAAETPGEVSVNSGNCALCQIFCEDVGPFDECRGCPVRGHTGRHYCYDTPYYTARDALVRWTHDDTAFRADWRKAAQAEVDFLKSLLPDEERENAD